MSKECLFNVIDTIQCLLKDVKEQLWMDTLNDSVSHYWKVKRSIISTDQTRTLDAGKFVKILGIASAGNEGSYKVFVDTFIFGLVALDNTAFVSETTHYDVKSFPTF